MDAPGLRRIWNEFYEGKQHSLLPSSSLIPTHPTAPMFTNSGMMQFVPYFLAEEPVPFTPPRAATIQKCVRLAGKHNDTDELAKLLVPAPEEMLTLWPVDPAVGNVRNNRPELQEPLEGHQPITA